MKRALAAIALLFAFSTAFAHTSGTSFLTLRAEDAATVHAEWDFDLRDLHQLLQLDGDRDGAVTWAEIVAARLAIESLVVARTRLSSAGGACTLVSTEVPAIAEHGDGPYLRFIATFSCAAGPLALDHTGWLEFDAGHRALLEYEARGGARSQAILSSGTSRWQSKGSIRRRRGRRRSLAEGETFEAIAEEWLNLQTRNLKPDTLSMLRARVRTYLNHTSARSRSGRSLRRSCWQR